MAHRIAFTGKQQVELEQYSNPELEDGKVLVRTLYSLMSTGTENIVFNRLFDEGSHWDEWVKYPFYPGYSLIGEVAEVASDVTSVHVGDKVALRANHSSQHLYGANECLPVPGGIDLKQAAWFALAKIAFMGARVAEYKIGDSVLIIGAGPIGQMSTRWAAASGAQTIIVVDPVGMRLDMATRGGATHTISAGVDECRDQVMEAMGGRLPRLVMDSTGHAAVFAASLKLAADRGKVVVMGDTGSPTAQHLTSDVVMRGVSIVGAHDGHTDDTWNDRTITQYFFSLVKSGRFSLDGLITHEFTPEACADAYGVANTRRSETMGILFDWTRSN